MISEQQAAEAQAAIDVAKTAAAHYVTVTDPDAAGALLTEIAARIRDLKKRRDEILGPLDEARRKLNALFAPALGAYDVAKEQLKAVVAAAVTERRATQQHALAVGDVRLALSVEPVKAAVRFVKRWRIVDELSIPPEYWCPDSAAIAQAVTAGVTIPGIEVYDEPSVIAR